MASRRTKVASIAGAAHLTDDSSRSMMVPRSKEVIVAGTNGAGKTPFAREFLPQEAGCPRFINAGLPNACDRAGTPFPRPSFAVALSRAGRTSRSGTGGRWTHGCSSIIREMHRSSSTGVQVMNPKPIEEPDDPMVKGAMAAMRRAARRAREIAAQTGTYVVLVRDGEIVWEVPGPEFFPKPAPPRAKAG